MSSPLLYTRSCIQWWRRAYMRVMAGFIQEMFQQIDEMGGGFLHLQNPIYPFFLPVTPSFITVNFPAGFLFNNNE